MRHAADEADPVRDGRSRGLRAQRLLHRPAADQQQMRLGPLRQQQRHRRDQIVEPFIIVEGADEADRIGIVEAEAAGEGAVRRPADCRTG